MSDPISAAGVVVSFIQEFESPGNPERRMNKKKRGHGKKWIASVQTVSTHPPPGLFTKSASEIARTLASKRVSPKGPVSGLRMLTFFINRAGKGLSAARRRELEKAKILLSNRVHNKGTQAARRKRPTT